MSESRKIKSHELVEMVFDILYLAFALVAGIVLLSMASGRLALRLFGITALVLAIGDSFHLVPRIMSIISQDKAMYHRAMGVGKLVTSITMTIFYVLLVYVNIALFHVELSIFLWIAVYGLAIIRIVACLCPQNNWLTVEKNVQWSMIRNIPFAILGAVVTGIYIYTATIKLDLMVMMPIAIFFSFVFYTPVALYSWKNPKLGVLMLPKTVMYIWIIALGLCLI